MAPRIVQDGVAFPAAFAKVTMWKEEVNECRKRKAAWGMGTPKHFHTMQLLYMRVVDGLITNIMVQYD